jgi:hypothetical protein
MDLGMVKDSINILMVISIKGFGSMIKNKDKEY